MVETKHRFRYKTVVRSSTSTAVETKINQAISWTNILLSSTDLRGIYNINGLHILSVLSQTPRLGKRLLNYWQLRCTYLSTAVSIVSIFARINRTRRG